MVFDYDTCVRKWERANTHLASLRDEISAFLESHSYEIVPERDNDRLEYVFRIYGIRPTPPEFGLIIGDVVHNLRSALDHLIYELALLGKPTLTDKEARSCEFPIFTSPDDFKSRGESKIRLLRKGERTRIEELQPYNAFEQSIWFPTFAHVPHALERLHALDIRDKHRTLNTTWQSFDPPVDGRGLRVAEDLGLTEYRGSESKGGALEDGAEISRWRFDGSLPDLPSDMDMNRYFPVTVSIEGSGLAASGVRVLEFMSGAVAFVFAVFRPCVTLHAPPHPLNAVPDPIGQQFAADFEEFRRAMGAGPEN